MLFSVFQVSSPPNLIEDTWLKLPPKQYVDEFAQTEFSTVE